MHLLFTMRYLIRNLSLIQKTLCVHSGEKVIKMNIKSPTKIMATNFPKLMKNINPCIHECQQTPSKIKNKIKKN